MLRRKRDVDPSPISNRIARLPYHELTGAAEATIYTLGRAIHAGQWDEATMCLDVLDEIVARARNI